MGPLNYDQNDCDHWLVTPIYSAKNIYLKIQLQDKKKSKIFFSIFFQNIQDLADDVIMTSSYKLQLDLYINIPNEFGEDRT